MTDIMFAGQERLSVTGEEQPECVGVTKDSSVKLIIRRRGRGRGGEEETSLVLPEN